MDGAIARLREAGYVSAERLALTAEGSEVARRFTGVGRGRVPAFRVLMRSRVVARALGIEPSDEASRRLAGADGLRAAVVARHHDLEAPGRTTSRRVVDALVWRELGFATDEPLTLNRLRAHVLGRVLGAPPRDVERLERQLVARAAQARRTDADAVRVALIGRWLASEDESTDVTSTIERFAAGVQDAADRDGVARAGPRKAFISSVWASMRRASPDEVPPLDTFKARLVEASRMGLIRLARADLVRAMDPVLVAESETTYLNATFHFVEISGGTA